MDLQGKSGASEESGEVQTELVAKGTSDSETLVLQRITIPRGGRTVWHKHPGVQYVIVESGSLRRDSDEVNTIRARSGEAIIEPPGDVHLGCGRGDEPVVLWVLSVVPKDSDVAIPVAHQD